MDKLKFHIVAEVEVAADDTASVDALLQEINAYGAVVDIKVEVIRDGSGDNC